MSITRRAFLGAAAAAPFLTSFSVRASDAPISLYVPYGAGGPVDVVVVEDEGRDTNGSLVYRGRRTMIVRPPPREA